MNLIKKQFEKFTKILTSSEKKKLLILGLLLSIGALFETLGIGLIISFLKIISNPTYITSTKPLNAIFSYFNFKTDQNFIIIFTFSIFLLFFVKNIYLIFSSFFQNEIIFQMKTRLSKELFSIYLFRPYFFHLSTNSSKLIRNLNSELERSVISIIVSFFQIFTELLIVFFIGITIFFFSPEITVLIFLLLGGSGIIFNLLFKNKIKINSIRQYELYAEQLKQINEGLGLIREIKLYDKYNAFTSSFNEANKKYNKITRFTSSLEQMPRYFFETLFVLMVIVLFLITFLKNGNSPLLFESIGIFAVGVFRLLPSLNRIIACYHKIKKNLYAFGLVSAELSSKKIFYIGARSDKENQIDLNGVLEVKSLFFSYPEQAEPVFNNFSLTFPRKGILGIIAPSGRGKTTLINLILGFYVPQHGDILVNGFSIFSYIDEWRNKVSYMPQNPFFLDGTILDNIVLKKKNDIRIDEVWRSLQLSNLDTFVRALPEQLNTRINEKGSKFSVGQLQRLALARALFYDRNFLILDEPTSSVEEEIEKKIMHNIVSLKKDKMIILISHKPFIKDLCDNICYL